MKFFDSRGLPIQSCHRRYRGDMIELFKILKGIYDPLCVPQLDLVQISEDTIRTRGNTYKLIKHHCYYDLRKFNFTNRVIPVWNSLPNHVVSADTINTFKNRLDKFWSDQEELYDYNADLHGIGNRSLVTIILYNKYLWFKIYFSDTEASEGLLPSSPWWWW